MRRGRQREKQIPFGNDKQKSNGKSKCIDKSKCKRRSRFPAGMTNKKKRQRFGWSFMYAVELQGVDCLVDGLAG